MLAAYLWGVLIAFVFFNLLAYFNWDKIPETSKQQTGVMTTVMAGMSIAWPVLLLLKLAGFKMKKP
jgi:hypothetical protein